MICSSKLSFNILRNPVYTSLLITALALIVIYTLYRSDFKEGGWRLGIKTGFWLLIVVSAVMYVHYYALSRHMDEEHSQKGIRDVVSSVTEAANFQRVNGGGYSTYSVLGGDTKKGKDPEDPGDPETEPAKPLPSDDRPDNVSEPAGLKIEPVVLPSQTSNTKQRK